jgi:hypothetical protein
MKYIITEGKLENVLLKFLEEKDFINVVKIHDGKIYILLKHSIPSNESENLANQIQTMFDYHGEIYRPSVTEPKNIPVAKF